jgi:hypothetical protein
MFSKCTDYLSHRFVQQSLQVVAEDRNRFAGGRVKEPANRKQTKDELKQRFRPEDVVKIHQTATARDDAALATASKIAMFSGARMERCGAASNQRHPRRSRHGCPLHADGQPGYAGKVVATPHKLVTPGESKEAPPKQSWVDSESAEEVWE